MKGTGLGEWSGKKDCRVRLETMSVALAEGPRVNDLTRPASVSSSETDTLEASGKINHLPNILLGSYNVPDILLGVRGTKMDTKDTSLPSRILPSNIRDNLRSQETLKTAKCDKMIL